MKAANGDHPNVVQPLLTWQIASELGPGLQALLPEDMVGAAIERADDQGATALHHAVKKENIEIASMLIQYTAAVNCSDKQNNTPLHIATADGNLKMVKLLKENGALVNMKNSEGETPLMGVVLGHKACAIHTEICECPPDFGHISVVKYLLDNGADPNIAYMRLSPLNAAAQDNNFEIAYLLIRAGADVGHADNKLRTPLHNAADRGHLEMV